jgi:hypothetical protein
MGGLAANEGVNQITIECAANGQVGQNPLPTTLGYSEPPRRQVPLFSSRR